MDLYLVSPVFLRKMFRRSSTAFGDHRHLGNDMVVVLPEAPYEDESTFGAAGGERGGGWEKRRVTEEAENEAEFLSWEDRGRRRSSLDRMLRQHAYIIICLMCYAYTSCVPHQLD